MDSAQLVELKDLIDSGRANVIEDHEKFIRFLFLINKGMRIPQKTLAHEIKMSTPTFNRILRREIPKNFEYEERQIIWDYCLNDLGLKEDVNEQFLTRTEQFEVEFYKSFLSYYDITEISIRYIENNVLGTFVLWRWSTEIGGTPGNQENRDVVQGKVDFRRDEDTRCIKASMVQSLRDMSEQEIDRHPHQEIYDGFLFRRSNKHIMLLRKKKDPDFRVTIFYSDPRDTMSQKVIALKGFGMGMDANRLFVSPVYLERWSGGDDELRDKLGRYKFTDVPRKIRQILLEAEFRLF